MPAQYTKGAQDIHTNQPVFDLQQSGYGGFHASQLLSITGLSCCHDRLGARAGGSLIAAAA
jgi:hypothetical protein